MAKYWVVGSLWGGDRDDDALDLFLRRGYWYCWDKSSTPPEEETKGAGNSVAAQRERFKQITKGDRIAIKRTVSITDQQMEIRAIGIVKVIDLDEWRVYVDWLPIIEKNTPRIVTLKGYVASIHGPFQSSDPWVHEIFCA